MDRGGRESERIYMSISRLCNQATKDEKAIEKLLQFP